MQSQRVQNAMGIICTPNDEFSGLRGDGNVGCFADTFTAAARRQAPKHSLASRDFGDSTQINYAVGNLLAYFGIHANVHMDGGGGSTSVISKEE
mmetsp:Transcript_11798/g.19281  ORF Transcript_11798/g.19281 Transcript_11798/m.19281 type:complete len:94 (-) Transcript_11798:699-980(-)